MTATNGTLTTVTAATTDALTLLAAGDNCDSIAANFDITVAQRVTASTTLASSSASSASPSVSSSLPFTTPPAPTQSGIPANCDEYAVAETGDNCATIAAKYSITEAQFLALNPAISFDCTTGFWADEAYCVGVSGSSTTTRTPATPTSVASVTPPGPTQSGISSNCDEYYVAQSGDNCATVATKYDITEAQFLAWNPAISSDCTTGFLGN
ncbi:LysM peptidoglycan-binding domain-containing protein [Aspergillus aculeatinus CBS 121060]|uniref:Uncharacterized protein n=1 Tax=Aspergillus aculeatinus CBS 121060 TaxID=1448322 RepID=A0ACD1HPC0_9EURO|nr:hypothetical protein BO66DRAFT_433397 [Aspergillus aculeatinus CBS 121060]RAH75317.1 hypothetical protein BO66DRAFT_433397 [Aspergillus aculeatinus CBS 121060]